MKMPEIMKGFEANKEEFYKKLLDREQKLLSFARKQKNNIVKRHIINGQIEEFYIDFSILPDFCSNEEDIKKLDSLVYSEPNKLRIVQSFEDKQQVVIYGQKENDLYEIIITRDKIEIR